MCDSDVRLLASFLSEKTAVGKVTLKDINRFVDCMEKERDVPSSPKTLARRITSVKSLFRWLHQYGVLVVDPAEKILWEELRANMLGVHFRRQQVNQGFIVDFYCNQAGLVV